MGGAFEPAGRDGPALTDWLARKQLLSGTEATPPLAEGLGRWLGWKDAIALSAALNTAPQREPAAVAGAASATKSAASIAATTRLRQAAERARTALARTIDHDGPPADEHDFPPYRRHIATAQQAMESAIASLRAQARDALGRQDAALQRLAALDAVMERVVGEREQALLGMAASLHERHFTRLRREAEGGDGWLAVFRHDLRHGLHAELAQRLQPVHGLIDALHAPNPEHA